MKKNPLHASVICSFTLIELLVVIAIIAILAGMLLPALNQSRETAKKIHCLNNIRELSMQYKSYADDFNSWVMPANMGFGDTTKFLWTNYVATKIYGGKFTWGGIGCQPRRLKLFECPSESTNLPYTSSNPQGFLYGHYGVNGLLVGDIINLNENNKISKFPPRKESTIRHPGEAVLLMDSPNKTHYAINILVSQYLDTVALRHGGGGSQLAEDSNHKYYRWGKMLNLSYYDGHARSISRSEMFCEGYNRKLLRKGFDNDYAN